MIKNIVYKKNDKLRKCKKCTILLVPQNGTISYWYGDGDHKDVKRLVRIEADMFNSWNGTAKYCNMCLSQLFTNKRYLTGKGVNTYPQDKWLSY